MSDGDKNEVNVSNETFGKLFETLKSELNLEFVFCPAGSFVMGSLPTLYAKPKGFWDSLFGERKITQKGELGRDDEEYQHKVTLTRPFCIGKFQLTQAQYKAITGKQPEEFKGDDYPVEHIDWDEANKIIEILNKRFEDILPEGYKFDLPTEAQWEYSCRAGTTTALNNDKNLTSISESCSNLDEVGWYDKNSDKKIHPVGQKKTNAWGIYDMHGNVWEWCRDYFYVYPETELTDPSGVISGRERVLRGGACSSPACFCRSAYRTSIEQEESYRHANAGIRLAIAFNNYTYIEKYD